MKKQLLFLFAALLPLVASAQTKVEIDGIWYNLYSDESKAEVTYKGSSYDEYKNEYSGSVNLPATVTYEGVDYSVTSIGRCAFSECSSLTAINIPESVTSIGDQVFSFCSSLTTINIPEGVTSIEYGAFMSCSSLTAINIPESVTSIGDYAFTGCSSLTAINIPEGVTSIGDYAFTGCSSLTAITIPENSQLTSIGMYAFALCERLTAITIPEGVTSIEDLTFAYCSKLTTIVLPKNLNNVGSQAFANCPELLDVYCYAEKVPSTESDAFDGSYIEGVYDTLHVPASALKAYKTTSPWSNFGNIEKLTDEETGIENPEIRNHKSEITFDLRGRRVEKAEKGIYIVNGKKTVIK